MESPPRLYSTIARRKWGILCLFFLIFSPNTLSAQTILKGIVKNTATGEPLPFINIAIVGTAYGTTSDTNGTFSLKTRLKKGQLHFSFIGFKTQTVIFDGSETLDIYLEEDPSVIEVDIVGKTKYRNKGNPAVELIRKVIEHKARNRQNNTPYLQYEEYEKIKLGLVNPGEEITDNPLFRQFQFMTDNLDTASLPGSRIFTGLQEESIYHRYFKQSPPGEKAFIKARKRIEFDKRFINNESGALLMRYLYEDIDIYKNNIYLLTNSFLSPIADMAPTFYKFYIKDTINAGIMKTVRLSFTPRNTADLLFKGDLYITLDGNYAVHRADLNLDKNAAINWVNNLSIQLNYQQAGNGKYYLSTSRTSVHFGLNQSEKGVYGERLLSFKNYDTETILPDTLFTLPLTESRIDNDEILSLLMERERPIPLTDFESQTYANYDSLNKMHSFNRILKWGSFLFAGYLDLEKFELGPWGTFFSANEIEGFKLRLAGRTTERMSKRIFLEGNVAYGFNDRKWKHHLSAAYAFNNKSVFTYPKHFIRFSHTFDTRTPGLEIQFQEEENILLSIKRGKNDKLLYNDIYRLKYLLETKFNLRIETALETWKQQPAGAMYFISNKNTPTDTLNAIATTDLGILLRWAPHEKMFDKKQKRTIIPNRYPVITAGFNIGVPDLLGGQFGYRKLQLTVAKRFILSQLGHADVTLGSGYLWGKVPYPLLFIPRANQTYNFHLYSYNLMNFMEFVSDQFAEVNIDYHMHGFIFNKIPLLKKLRLREVLGFKGIYGNVRHENNPIRSPDLFYLPGQVSNDQTTFTFDKQPYMEFNAGIENILNFLRIDYVKRLNYLNHPNIANWGIRARVHLSL